jgi:hypothetical protein
MAQYGVTVTWSELTGQRPTIEQLREQLAPYGLSSVFLGLARISAILKTFLNRYEEIRQLDIIRRTLPGFYESIKARLAANSNRVAITRTSILFVAKQALLTCSAHGPDAANMADVERITMCCLMANDLLLAQPAGPDDPTMAKAASMLTFSTYVPQDSYPLDIARNLLLINEIAPQLVTRADYRDLRAAFIKAAGLTPEHFCELIFCVTTKFINIVDEQGTNQGFILQKTFFQHTAIPEEEIEAFFSAHTTTLESLQQRAQSNHSLNNDFLIFQDRPLLEFGPGTYLCIDPGFLLEKAGKAFYWTLHATTPTKELLGYWASAIDRYAQWHATQTYRGTGKLMCSPKFADGAEAADLLLVEGQRLLIMEVKACTLTAQAKYSFNATLLMEELERKAIEGEDGERKGVAQLRHNINRLLNGDSIPDIDLRKITKIYPILVFVDDSFVAPYLGEIYRKALDPTSLKRRLGPKITTLYAITLDDLRTSSHIRIGMISQTSSTTTTTTTATPGVGLSSGA